MSRGRTLPLYQFLLAQNVLPCAHSHRNFFKPGYLSFLGTGTIKDSCEYYGRNDTSNVPPKDCVEMQLERSQNHASKEQLRMAHAVFNARRQYTVEEQF